MHFYQLIYQSQATVFFDKPMLVSLLNESRQYNAENFISGLLLHTPDGRFLQVLEGAEADVRELFYQRITADPRHHHWQVLSEESCLQRSFADWNMGFSLARPEELNKLLQQNSPAALMQPDAYPELLDLLLEFVGQHKIEAGH